jgi:hypothetical protein
MKQSRLICFVIGILASVSIPADASPDPVTMASYGTAGQTQLFRGDLSGLGTGTFNTVTVQDALSGGGSDGVFSGFDLDFILLDRDGNLSTTADQILAFENSSTSLASGSARNPVTSPYQPTPSHPGALFGLNTDGSIDFATATIATRDGTYDPYSLAVDTSNGWVTLGDGGVLTVRFPETMLTGSGMWVFAGEVGMNEVLLANIEIADFKAVPAPGAIILGVVGVGFIGCFRRQRTL